MEYKKFEGTTETHIGQEVTSAAVQFAPLGCTQIKLDPASREMEFEFLTGDMDWVSYGGKWISKEPKDVEDFGKCWFVIEFLNMLDACGRDVYGEPPFIVTVSVVCPDSVSEKDSDSAWESCGVDPGDTEITDEMTVEVFHSYGLHAPVWQHSCGTPTEDGDDPSSDVFHNDPSHPFDCEAFEEHYDKRCPCDSHVDWEREAEDGVKYAKQAAVVIDGLFGFFMDQPLNRMGTSGWGFASGQL